MLIVLSTVTFQMWHLELITGLVILVSSCRYLLLKTWPDFAESSEAANSQVGTYSHTFFGWIKGLASLRYFVCEEKTSSISGVEFT